MRHRSIKWFTSVHIGPKLNRIHTLTICLCNPHSVQAQGRDQDSQHLLSHPWAMWLWLCYLPILCLSILIYEMAIMMLPISKQCQVRRSIQLMLSLFLLAFQRMLKSWRERRVPGWMWGMRKWEASWPSKEWLERSLLWRLCDHSKEKNEDLRILNPSPVQQGERMCSAYSQKALLGAKRMKWKGRCQIKNSGMPFRGKVHAKD